MDSSMATSRNCVTSDFIEICKAVSPNVEGIVPLFGHIISGHPLIGHGHQNGKLERSETGPIKMSSPDDGFSPIRWFLPSEVF